MTIRTLPRFSLYARPAASLLRTGDIPARVCAEDTVSIDIFNGVPKGSVRESFDTLEGQ
ncbi:hypothetical protein GCM10010432_40340 [Catellatospora methionotrophica]